MATLVQAVRMALHYGEEHLGVTDVFGEDVGPPLGGVFTATQGLKTAWNSPLDERGIIGTAMGIAYAGGRPVAEIQFCDYGFNTIDLLKVAGNQRWAGAGNYDMPIVVMTPSGSGIRGSLYHSHSFESWAARLAGWKVVMPSTPLDAYGLMLSAIADPNPVLYLMPKALLRVRGEEKLPGEPDSEDELKKMIDAPVGDRGQWQPKWPDLKPLFIKFGEARLRREGESATVVTYGRTLFAEVFHGAGDGVPASDGVVAITIVTGGDAGTHEGDFASCMIWSTRPGFELPVLMIVMNNHWGISTPAGEVHAEERVIDRGKAFGIMGEVVDGNDPIASWHAIARAMKHLREKRRPFMLEAYVSRLYGHSSSSGALRVNETDGIPRFEDKLKEAGVIDDDGIKKVHEEAKAETEAALEQALKEPKPSAADIEKWTYAPSEVDAVYPGDYTGLPR